MAVFTVPSINNTTVTYSDRPFFHPFAKTPSNQSSPWVSNFTAKIDISVAENPPLVSGSNYNHRQGWNGLQYVQMAVWQSPSRPPDNSPEWKPVEVRVQWTTTGSVWPYYSYSYGPYYVPATASASVPHGSGWYLHVKAKNNNPVIGRGYVNNVFQASREENLSVWHDSCGPFRTDKTILGRAPTGTFSLSSDRSEGTFYNNDNVSHIKQYSVGSTNNWINYTGPVKFSEPTYNGTVIYIRGRSELSMEWTPIGEVTINGIVPPLPVLNAAYSADKRSAYVSASYYPSASHRYFRIGNIAWQQYTGAVTVTDKTVAYAYQTVNGVNSSTASLSLSDFYIPDAGIHSLALSDDGYTAAVTLPLESGWTTYYRKKGAATWTKYTGPFNITANGAYEFYRISDGGLSTKISEFEVNIIRSRDPIITVTPKLESGVQTSVSVGIAAAGANAIYYRVDTDVTGTWVKYLSAFTLASNSTVFAYATSAGAAQSNTVSRAITGFGKTPPEISVNIAPDYSSANITLTDISNAANIFYRLDGGSWVRYTGPFNITKNTVISAKSSLGSLESETVTRSVTGIGIDSPMNQITISFALDVSGYFGTVTLKCDNAKEIVFQVNYGTFDQDNNFWLKEEGDPIFYSGPFVLMENSQIIATATLKDGRSPAPRTLNIHTIKNTKPEINIEYAQNLESAVVTISNPALVSIFYFLNNDPNRVYTGPFTVRSDASVSAQGRVRNIDRLSKPASAQVNLSVLPPTIKTEYSRNGGYADVSFIPASPDHRVRYQFNDGAWADYE